MAERAFALKVDGFFGTSLRNNIFRTRHFEILDGLRESPSWIHSE